MRYWLYKCHRDGGPAGYWGDWRTMVFEKNGPVQWGGHYSTRSAEVAKHLDEAVAVGDVVVSYQTDELAVVGFCRIERITGAPGAKKLWLLSIESLSTPFMIHKHKHGTNLEHSIAVNGPLMLRELAKSEVGTILRLTGSPSRVLQGKPPPDGWRPTVSR